MGPAMTTCKQCGSKFSINQSKSPTICNLCFQANIVRGAGQTDVYESVKPERYTDTKGRDLIDDWSDRKTPEEVRAALLFNIEKYSRRYGKKDDNISEAKKIADYAQRLLNFERQLLSDNS